MTIALAIVFLALLLLYCGVKGRSFRHAVTGKAMRGGEGKIVQ